MIVAYVGTAALSSVVYLAMKSKMRKKRMIVSTCLFVLLSAAFTVWFIQTGGSYGIIGKNGITPNWTTK